MHTYFITYVMFGVRMGIQIVGTGLQDVIRDFLLLHCSVEESIIKIEKL